MLQPRVDVAAVDRAVTVAAIAELGAIWNAGSGMPVVGDGMALQALHGLGDLQQATIGRAVRVVADGAVFNHRGMFKYFGPADGLMALVALVVLVHQAGLLAAMRVVAADAGEGAFLDGVMGGHVEARGDILVAVHAGSRFLVGFPQGQVELSGLFGRMHAVAIAALDLGLFVR